MSGEIAHGVLVMAEAPPGLLARRRALPRLAPRPTTKRFIAKTTRSICNAMRIPLERLAMTLP
jgi:hypothetical protein